MFTIGPQVMMASNMTVMVAVEAAASTCVFSKTFANHRSYRLDRFSVLELVNPGRRQTHASTIRRSVSVRRTIFHQFFCMRGMRREREMWYFLKKRQKIIRLLLFPSYVNCFKLCQLIFEFDRRNRVFPHITSSTLYIFTKTQCLKITCKSGFSRHFPMRYFCWFSTTV